jgi:hypothetical protein
MTAAQLAADELLPFSDFPTETIHIGIGNYQCLVAQFERGNNLEVGGLALDYDLSVMIERASLHNVKVEACINEGNRVVFRNELFSVARVKQDDAQSYVTVFLRHAGERQPVNPLLSAEGNWLLTEDGRPIEG